MSALHPLSLLCAAICVLGAPAVGAAAEPIPNLVSARVERGPELDGALDDAAWQSARPLTVTATRVLPPDVGRSASVTLRSVHTDSEIFFAATWDDASESVTHKSWVWNAQKKAYETGSDREDMFAVAFEHAGTFNPDMLAGVEGAWDVWHWKASRTNPHGFAMDKTHRYTLAQPQGKAKSHRAKNGQTIWIARPEDAGDSVEKSVPAPAQQAGERVAAYAGATPSASAADVRAKGRWAGGKWNLEMVRKLVTGNPDDTAFDTARTYQLGIAAFDQTGDMDKASGAILLSFASGSRGHDFEADRIDQPPAGFTSGLTAGGGPVDWRVIEANDAPSGKHVVAQLSRDGTDSRYPLLVLDAVTAKDVDVSVRFKPVSGEVDQAAGIVWRWQDKDNYLIVRANALENNVVAYKTVGGKRTSIGIKDNAKAYGVKAPVLAGKWSTLRVRMVGDTAQIHLDGKKLFEVDTTAITSPGRVGLWTKADSVTWFDDLEVTSLDGAAKGTSR